MEGRAGSGYRPRSDGAKPFQCSFTCTIPACDHRKTNKQETKTTTETTTTNPKHHHNGFHALRLHGMEDSCERSEDWASRVGARYMYHFLWHQCGFSAVLPPLSQILLLSPGWPRNTVLLFTSAGITGVLEGISHALSQLTELSAHISVTTLGSSSRLPCAQSSPQVPA